MSNSFFWLKNEGSKKGVVLSIECDLIGVGNIAVKVWFIELSGWGSETEIL